MRKRVCMLFMMGIATIASANTIIKPVSVALTPSGSQYLQDNPATHWLNGSGLSAATMVEGGDPVPAVWPTHTHGYASGPSVGHMARVRNATGGTAELTFDLGDAYDLTGIALWNNGETGHTDRGIQTAVLAYSTDDGVTFTAGETLTFLPAPDAMAPFGPDVQWLSSASTHVTHLRMTVQNFDSSEPIVSFHEIRMIGQPSPIPDTGYPRLLFSNDDIPALKQNVQSGWLNDAFEVMVDNADDYMNISVTPYLVIGASAGRRVNEQVNTLALTGILLDDDAYLDHAIAMCMSAIEQTGVDDYYALNGHLAVADALHAYAVAYDWLYNYMTPSERTLLYDEVVEFMDWVYADSVDSKEFEPTPLSSNHNSVHHGALGLAALAISTNDSAELQRAAAYTEGYFRYARDATGYNSEGIGYYGYGSLGAIPFSVAYERAGFGNLIDEDQKNERVTEQLLRFVQPWGGSVVALNDSNDLAVGGGMMEFISRYQDEVGLWTWLKMFGAEGDGTYSGPDSTSYTGMGCTIPYVILFADETLQPRSPEDAGLPLGKFFDRGTGAFRSSWQDDAALATFTCGPDIHRGHNHRDEGSFTFSAFGEYFVIDPGYDPNMGRAHNCVTVNGVDQEKEEDEYDTYGLTLATKDFGDAWYMKGDATTAYPDALNLDHAIRQFMFVKAPQPYLIVRDDIEGAGSNDFSWLLHAGKDSLITQGSSAGEFYLEGDVAGGAVCYVKFLGPTEGLSFAETDLNGVAFENSLGSPKYFSNYFREFAVNYTGVNPKYTVLLIAAESIEDLPEIGTTPSADGLRVNVRFPTSGTEDQILISDQTMDFHRLENVFYLHADMPVGSSPENTTLWFEDRMGGSSLDTLDDSMTPNYFDLNGYALRAPNTQDPATFNRTFLVSDAGADICMLYADEWSVAGFDVGNEIAMRPHKESIDLSISNLVLRANGNMQFRTLIGGNNTVNLSVATLSGNGQLSFGTSAYANDVNGEWGLAISDPTSEFSGTIELIRGTLSFDNSFALSNATLKINSAEENTVLLTQDVTFAAVEVGSSVLDSGQYTAGQVNSALGTDRFSGAGILTVLASPAIYYLQGGMPAGDSILDTAYWFDARTGGASMEEDALFSGNRFVVNRNAWRAPNTSETAVFDGTLVVDHAGSGLLVHYCADLHLNGGLELDRHLVVRPHRTAVSMSVSDLTMGDTGELIFRTLIPDNNTQSLSVTNLSGSGCIQFGTSSGNDTNGVWSFTVSDATPEFRGTVQLLSGELTFDNAMILPDATFKIEPSWDNHVVLDHDIEFSRLKMGAVTLVSGTYTASELNTVLGTDRFSGQGTVTVNLVQNNFAGWIAEYELSGEDALPNADLDSDGMNNLMEYALGGDPGVDDAAAIQPSFSMVNEAGSKWMDYIYRRRMDAEARGLRYDVLLCTNLTEGIWFKVGQMAEESSIPMDSDFESVKNRIPADHAAQFITLEISEE